MLDYAVHHSAGGAMRTESSSRPLMRRKPICSDNPNFSAGRHRSSIICRSASVKNASISKGAFRKTG
jgi:hypothetical protein